MVIDSVNAFFMVEGFKCIEPKQTAMLMIAIGRAIECVRTMYKDQKQCVLPIMPMISFVEEENMNVELKVTDREMHKHVYRANGPRCISSQRYYAIKFTESYSFELHRLLEENGFAPKLRSHYSLQSGFYCIIMDWISPVVPCEELVELEISIKREIARQLFQILDILKTNGFVIGDVRSPNILITRVDEAYKVIIIDFDFSGKLGEAIYPVELNMREFPWLDESVLMSEEGRKLSHSHDRLAVLDYLRNVLELSDDDENNENNDGEDEGEKRNENDNEDVMD